MNSRIYPPEWVGIMEQEYSDLFLAAGGRKWLTRKELGQVAELETEVQTMGIIGSQFGGIGGYKCFRDRTVWFGH